MKVKKKWWAVVRVRHFDVHCVPLHDLRKHKKRRDCPCCPRFENKYNDPISGEDEEAIIVIHDPWDGRR